MSNDRSIDVPADRLSLSRRSLLGATASTAAMLTAGCSKAAKWETKTVQSDNGVLDLDIADYPELATAGGMLALMPSGQRKPILIMRLEDDRFRAMSLRCPHVGCTVRWDNEQQLLVCPCHNSTFDDAGVRQSGPAKESLQQFPAQMLDTHVQVKLPKA